MQNFKLPAQSNNEVIDTSIKRYPENMYTFAMWPTTGNVYRISGYLFKHEIMRYPCYEKGENSRPFYNLRL